MAELKEAKESFAVFFGNKSRIQSLAVIAAALPLCSFVFCVLWSLKVNFNASTSTHCNVVNLLPSVSAATAAFTPQKYVWKVAVALHTIPRLVVSFVFYRLKKSSKVTFVFSVTEIISLLALSLVSSTENFAFHAKCFTVFLVTAIVHMFLLTSQDMSKRKKHRKLLTVINASATLFAVYFYIRHNQYCEPGVYSLFALSEYIVVLTNIAFNFQVFYDFEKLQYNLLV